MFDALLRGFNGLVQPRMFQLLAFFHAEAFHHLRHALGGTEVAHEIVFEADEELALAGVSLTGATTTQLAVHATAFVTLRADDEEATEFADAFAEFDVRSTTGHVGGNRHGSTLTGTCDDLRFLTVILRVQNCVWDLLLAQHARERL